MRKIIVILMLIISSGNVMGKVNDFSNMPCKTFLNLKTKFQGAYTFGIMTGALSVDIISSAYNNKFKNHPNTELVNELEKKSRYISGAVLNIKPNEFKSRVIAECSKDPSVALSQISIRIIQSNMIKNIKN